eukprot:619153-Prymnesium_polylepis.1
MTVCPSAVRQTVGILSVRLIDVTPMLSCSLASERDFSFYGRTRPSPRRTLSLLLRSHSSISGRHSREQSNRHEWGRRVRAARSRMDAWHTCIAGRVLGSIASGAT